MRLITTYNDGDDLIEYLNTINDFLMEHFELYELIVVDDGSTDGTPERIKSKINLGGVSITLVSMGLHQGLELSMNAGVDIAIGDFVFEFDSVEITYDLDVILKIYIQCLQGSDIVAAVSDKNRNISSHIFYGIYNYVSKSSYKLQTDAFRILSRRAINRVHSMSNTLPYRKAVYANCGLNVSNIHYTSVSESKRRKEKQYRIRTAIDAFVLYTDLAYKLASVFTVLMLAMTAGFSIYAIIIRLQGIPVEGWTSTVLVICFSFFGMSLIVAIMTKYLELVLKTVFMNHKYTVRSVDKI